jgi:hypothetical protein
MVTNLMSTNVVFNKLFSAIDYATGTYLRLWAPPRLVILPTSRILHRLASLHGCDCVCVISYC